MPDETQRRKDAHLDLCATGDVEPAENDPLFGDVHLVHECLPELDAADVDGGCTFLGKRLTWPLLITGMTGGTARAGAVNRDLARIADELGIAFGVGSQRAMQIDPSVTPSFQVRDVAPRVALLGNIGLWQARELGVDGVRRLVEAIGADGLAIHLNAGQEMVQPEGDRDFAGGLKTIEAFARAFGDRLVVKETGCGIGPSSAKRLVDAGVKNLDVSGLGGTSWVKVEALRAEASARRVGEAFAGWGIPTAAAVASVARAVGDRATLIASGGIRDGLMAAKAIGLGASRVGVALPVFRGLESGGIEGARSVLTDIISGLRLAMVLSGAKDLRALARRPPVVTGRLGEWLAALQ